MIRAAVLTVVLTLAGTPAAATACLIWCETSPAHCQPETPQTARALTAPNGCDEVVSTAPVLREDSRRSETASTAFEYPASRRLTVGAQFGSRNIALALRASDSPPGHLKSPTVLRL